MTGWTEDRFLGGRVIVRQPAKGFRAGLDAVMLAASVPARAGDEVLELGAGAGTASLCLAARVAGCSISGVEIERALVTLANESAAANDLAGRVSFVEGDVFALPAGLRRGFAHVFCNPPFHGAGGETSPDAARTRALHDAGTLAGWLEAGVARTGEGGSFTAILRADRLDEALAALPESGAVILPLLPHAGEAPKRAIVQLRKGSRAPHRRLPGLVLHEAGGQYTRAADAILRDGQALVIGGSGL